ncbi:MAG: hypothetical protein VXY93_15930, partial [Pseudomonadota bacterium]|nr:hypothetical protein [Pseudomonadota bacterium]
LIANVIQFTAAPGVGDEIQVRHMGFAGATTSDVTGFYGRTGNVVLTSNDHITTGNINAGIVTATTFDGAFSSGVGGSNANFTGIVTAGTFKGGNIDAVDGAFSGNVTIGGTLTYEDVSNIDSVGIVTAQKDVHVGAGLSVVGVSTLGTGGSGQVFLKHQGSTRLETTSTGIKAYGNDHLFTTESTGDCRIILQSDSDNNAENDNSAVVFRQDGSADIGAIGVNLTNSTSIPPSQELFV